MPLDNLEKKSKKKSKKTQNDVPKEEPKVEEPVLETVLEVTEEPVTEPVTEKPVPEPEPVHEPVTQEPEPEPEPEPVQERDIKPELNEGNLREENSNLLVKNQDKNITEELLEDKINIEEKEALIDSEITPIDTEILKETSEVEKSDDSGNDSQAVATISEDLSDLKDIPLEELKELAATIPSSDTKKINSLAKVLKEFTIDTKALNLKKIRKQELAGSSKARAAEVITNNSTLFAKGRSKIARRITKLGVLESRAYSKIVDKFIKEKWKLPIELNAKLEIKVRLIIAKDGTLLQYAFDKVSGNKIFDNSVRSLFSKLKKLPPLPENFAGKLTELGLKFAPR